jgi:uncharacterized protein DUF3649
MSDQERKRSARLTYPGFALLFAGDGSLVPARTRITSARAFWRLAREERPQTELAVLAVGRGEEVNPASALRKLFPWRSRPKRTTTKRVAIKWEQEWARGSLTFPENRTDEPQIALLVWNVEHDGVHALSKHARERLRVQKLADPTPEAFADGLEDVYADARPELDLIRGDLERWERQFRREESLSQGQHEVIEETMARLARLTRSVSGDSGSKEATDHAALVARFDRLLDAQASRDATGALERVVSVLAALVLVPALVAGVYGANVPLPLKGSPAGLRAMLGLMALGGAITYIGLSAMRPSEITRNISLHVPGAPRERDKQDLSWLPRPVLCGLAGGAIGTALNAFVDLDNVDVLREAPSTGYALLGGMVLLAIASLVIVVADVLERSPLHACIDVVIVALTGGALYWFFRDDWPAVVCLLVLGLLAGAFFISDGLREWMCGMARRHAAG